MNGMSEDLADIKYLSGFGNEFASEAVDGALPEKGNNPKNCPYGLYAEQLSGTAFTVPRRVDDSDQKRTWMYRILPSVNSTRKTRLDGFQHVVSDFMNCVVEPNQLRWKPLELKLPPGSKIDFIHGIRTLCGSGSVSSKSGFAIHAYAMNEHMSNTSFVNADGDYLLVNREGLILVKTEFGRLTIGAKEICVIPRGMVFSVDLLCTTSGGFLLEIFEGHFRLPELGPIGANCLANPRDFEHPIAWYEDRKGEFQTVLKFQGQFFSSPRDYSPFDVVAWHGNYLPYKYSLEKFCPVNSVLFDHPDPSIFTVLTVQSCTPGVAVVDFVIFPPRYLVAENTFRPPYFHRNCMNEFMGSLDGQYDAKKGFLPGCASLHVCMTPHGPDKASYEENVKDEGDVPVRIPNSSLCFMFETNFTPMITPFGMQSELLEEDYSECWSGFERRFDAKRG